MKKWTAANNYMGEEYPEYYVAGGQTRDSEALDRANFDATLKELGGESDQVLVIRSGHWAVGWIETILIHESAADKIAIGNGIEERLSEYPVLDDDLYLQYETEEVESNWKYFSLEEKRDMLAKAGMSRSLATRKNFPHKYDTDGNLYESFRNQ